MVAREVIDWVESLHTVVDELVAPVVAAHGPRITCHAGCHDCCSDGLSVFAIEAAVIERHHADLLANGVPNEDGGCVFLDERGQCRVYEHRPYVCRTQGLPLRWLERDEDGEPAEVRDVCPLNVEGPALEELDARECWTLGPFEERLAKRQAATDGGEGRRVALRSLFAGARRHLPIAR
jgi:Fe-S-cluster containining protein